MMMSNEEYNTCYYNTGDKHSCCTHPHYCIFNHNRIRLDNDIHQLETELHQRIKDLEFIKREGTHNAADYNQTKARIKYLNIDLERLREHRKNIIEREVKAYGYLEK